MSSFKQILSLRSVGIDIGNCGPSSIVVLYYYHFLPIDRKYGACHFFEHSWHLEQEKFLLWLGVCESYFF